MLGGSYSLTVPKQLTQGYSHGPYQTHFSCRRKAALRAAALASISPTLDLGNGFTLVAYNAAVLAIDTPTTGKLAVYNATLSVLDGELNDLQAAERALNTFSESMLSGTGLRYGKDSSEYEKGGGGRKSERKRPVSKKEGPIPK